MKSLTFTTLLIAGNALANPLYLFERAACNANNCLRAVRATPSNGLPFCTSVLGLQTTASVTITETAMVGWETTITVWETETFTTDFTQRVTITDAPIPFKAKRDVVADSKASKATANMIHQCSSDVSKIASACSCFLGSEATTITQTEMFTETVTPPVYSTYTITSYTSTTVGNAIATCTAILPGTQWIPKVMTDLRKTLEEETALWDIYEMPFEGRNAMRFEYNGQLHNIGGFGAIDLIRKFQGLIPGKQYIITLELSHPGNTWSPNASFFMLLGGMPNINPAPGFLRFTRGSQNPQGSRKWRTLTSLPWTAVSIQQEFRLRVNIDRYQGTPVDSWIDTYFVANLRLVEKPEGTISCV